MHVQYISSFMFSFNTFIALSLDLSYSFQAFRSQKNRLRILRIVLEKIISADDCCAEIAKLYRQKATTISKAFFIKGLWSDMLASGMRFCV